MKHKCTILRYAEVVRDGITSHELTTIADDQRCNYTQKSKTQIDERGYSYIASDERLILPASTDIRPGDIIRIHGEVDNRDELISYEAGKPSRPRNRFVSVRIKERTEQ